MSHITITLPDGTQKQFDKGLTGKEIAESIGQRLAQDALAIKLNGKLTDLLAPINQDAHIQIITFKDKEGVEVFHHSTAHLLAQAVLQLYPNAKPTIGPAVDEGFYYDFDIDHNFTPEDLQKIEAKMKQLVKENLQVQRLDLSIDDAKQTFKDNPYKIELIEQFNEPTSAYKQGDFIDLCRGPHLPSTGKIKALKLTKVAGAYWRGDQNNKQLQRIYGISFPDKKLLRQHLHLLQEAAKRDHRKLGRELELFSMHEEGPGFIFFHPKGMSIINDLLAFSRELNLKYGYEEIKTPIILHRKLWEQSGHWDHYKENMYFVNIDEQPFAVKPMNCPGSILIYKEKLHSYRELPLRLGEYGLVHRHELSGTLSGLFRVRSFTQDDAHIFVTPGQIQDEVKNVIDQVDDMYKAFNFQYHVELSTKPEKAMGSQDLWDVAQDSLRQALESKKMKFKINEGDGAFYGPKIDFHIKDCLGRTWQCATIQVDFQMPEKFNLSYIAEDNSKHRPVIIHRVLFGSVERFLGILIEHFAGKFPLWISPEQIRILTVADRFNDYAQKVKQKYMQAGLRVTIDDRAESISKKVREAQLAKVNYILVVGEKEIDNNTVTVRTRDNEVVGPKDIEEFLGQIMMEIDERK